MKVTAIKKRNIARELTKGYIRLLTQQVVNGVKAIDDYFIGEDDSEVRLWFYGSMAFGLAVTILILITVV